MSFVHAHIYIQMEWIDRKKEQKIVSFIYITIVMSIKPRTFYVEEQKGEQKRGDHFFFPREQ